ncbi:hypothetical protein DPMN_172867 [Dreissena polymorpha]|uniref:Uncharacterized protein n=1 Tax=Dreissena polymorpha TaxID=45954 RepID=A0A9D4IH07_DREPO|nr:hypothetical protein DPMN_172867 [Dreissena polymorpha]
MVRAKCTPAEVIESYFSKLKKATDANNISGKSQILWNTDETGLMMERNHGKIVCMKDQTVYSVTSARDTNVMIIAGGSASGIRLPRFYIFPCQRCRDDILHVDGSFPG